MNENEYKERLLERSMKFFNEHYINAKMVNKENGKINIYFEGNDKILCMVYYPYTATIKIPRLDISVIGSKELCAKMFFEHYELFRA